MILLAVILLLNLGFRVTATVFTGVWVPGADATDAQNILTLDAGGDDFVQVFSARFDQGLRLSTRDSVCGLEFGAPALGPIGITSIWMFLPLHLSFHSATKTDSDLSTM